MRARFILACILLTACAAAPARGEAPAASAPEPLTIGETFTLESAALAETRRINVYLPYVYAAAPDTALPVLYMPDGGLAEDFLHVAGLVQVLSGNGGMRAFILVGIENTQRRRDMTGPTQNPQDRTIAPVVGGSAAFRAFIRDELMPEIARRYRTTDETAIVGESLAGLFVVETMLLEPRMFDTYIAIDPSLWWNDAYLVEQAPRLLKEAVGVRRTLYMAASDEPQIAADAAALAAAMAAQADSTLSWRHVPMPQEHHGTIYHPAALQAFRAVLGQVPSSLTR